jgi:hypothetical protein
LESSLEQSLAEIAPGCEPPDWENAFYVRERTRRMWGAAASLCRRFLDVRSPFLDLSFLASALRTPAALFLDRSALARIIRRNDARLLRWPTTRGGFSSREGGSDLCRLAGWALLTSNRACAALSPRVPRLVPAYADRRICLPYARWFARELQPQLTAILLDGATRKRGLFDPRVLEIRLEAHRRRLRDYTRELAFCATVELAYRGLLS